MKSYNRLVGKLVTVLTLAVATIIGKAIGYYEQWEGYEKLIDKLYAEKEQECDKKINQLHEKYGRKIENLNEKYGKEIENLNKKIDNLNTQNNIEERERARQAVKEFNESETNINNERSTARSRISNRIAARKQRSMQ